MEEGADPRVVLDCLLDHIEASRSLDFAAFEADFNSASPLGGVLAGSPILSRIGTSAIKEKAAKKDAGEMSDSQPFFEGLGNGQNVPVYLRHVGSVKNLYFSQRDTIKLIHEIWESKDTFEKESGTQAMTPLAIHSTLPEPIPPPGFADDQRANVSGGTGRVVFSSGKATGTVEEPVDSRKVSPRKIAVKAKSNRKARQSAYPKPSPSPGKAERPVNPDMATFLNYFLRNRHKADFAVQVAYSLHDALERYSQVSDVKLFKLVLEGRTNQEVWKDQFAMIEDLHHAFSQENRKLTGDRKKGGPRWEFKNQIFDDNDFKWAKKEWRIDSDDIMAIVKNVFTTKTEQDFSQLAKALQTDAGGCKFIDPVWLLAEDRYGTRSHFLETLKLQHINECITQEQLLLQSIDKFAAIAAASAAATATAAASLAANNAAPSNLPQVGNRYPSNNSPTRLDTAERARRRTMMKGQPGSDKASTGEAALAPAIIEMTVGKFREALIEAQPSRSRDDVNTLLCRGCDASLEDMLLMEAKRMTVPVEQFKTRLRSKLLTAATRNIN